MVEVLSGLGLLQPEAASTIHNGIKKILRMGGVIRLRRLMLLRRFIRFIMFIG